MDAVHNPAKTCEAALVYDCAFVRRKNQNNRESVLRFSIGLITCSACTKAIVPGEVKSQSYLTLSVCVSVIGLSCFLWGCHKTDKNENAEADAGFSDRLETTGGVSSNGDAGDNRTTVEIDSGIDAMHAGGESDDSDNHILDIVDARSESDSIPEDDASRATDSQTVDPRPDAGLFFGFNSGGSDIVRASVGRGHTCVLKQDDSIICWGSNDYGQADTPVGSYTQVSAGDSFTCAIESSGRVVCWGRNDEGQTNTPSGSYVQVSSGSDHACALARDGGVTCWGSNIHGQATAPSGIFTQVSARGSLSCGLRNDGSISCWGEVHYARETFVPINIPPGSYKHLDVGSDSVCAIRSDGNITCVYPMGEELQNNVPSGNYTQISLSDDLICVLDDGGSVFCWSRVEPDEKGILSGLYTQVIGGTVSCAVTNDGAIACWGSSFSCQGIIPSGPYIDVDIGGGNDCVIRKDGSLACWRISKNLWISPPEDAKGPFIQVNTSGLNGCALRSDNNILRWGEDYDVEPDGTTTTVPDAGPYLHVDCGSPYCAIKSDGSIICWYKEDSDREIFLTGRFNQLSVGNHHGCAIRDDGSIECWGDNSNGQATSPAGSYNQINAGTRITCAIAADSSIVCWGDTEFLEGFDRFDSYKEVDCGSKFICAIKSDDSIVCWEEDIGLISVPEGSYTNLSVDGSVRAACAERQTDGAIVCGGGEADTVFSETNMILPAKL